MQLLVEHSNLPIWFPTCLLLSKACGTAVATSSLALNLAAIIFKLKQETVIEMAR